jgi:ComF family protein
MPLVYSEPMLSAIVNWLFPASCIVCDKSEAYLCEKCLSEREPPAAIEFANGEKPWITALFSYKDKFVKQAIWDIKYHGKFVAAHAFGERMAEAALALLQDICGLTGDEHLFADIVIVPIPPSALGRKKRGYNQAAILARALFENASFPCDLDLRVLEKVKVTEKQATLRDRRQRLRNMDGAFVADPERVRGKIVILVDDVVTTGATLRDARRACLSGGAKEVVGITIGH